MTKPSPSTTAGLGFLGTVFVVLLVLKLVHVAPVGGLSWWWVTAPLWGPWAMLLFFLLLHLALRALAHYLRPSR